MNRRGFLRAFATGAVAGVVAPAALAELLTPKRTIFLPPRGGWFGLDLASGPDITTLQTAIGAELDKLLSIGFLARKPIYYNDEGFEMIEARVHAALREFGETDAQLRARMFETWAERRYTLPNETLVLEGWPTDKVFEV